MKKYWTLGESWCGVLEEKGSTNLEDCNFTQNQRTLPQKIENSNNDSDAEDSGATSIYLL